MYTLKKLFLSIFAANLLSFSVLAHGPTRQKVIESIDINAESVLVWKKISDFKNFDWNPDVTESKAKNNDVGSERILKFKNGIEIVQKLEKVNQEKKLITWRLIKTDNKLLPVNSYAAKILVKSEKTGTSIVTYKAGFYRGFMGNDPPEELNDENSKKKVEEFIKKSLKGLKESLEKN